MTVTCTDGTLSPLGYLSDWSAFQDGETLYVRSRRGAAYQIAQDDQPSDTTLTLPDGSTRRMRAVCGMDRVRVGQLAGGQPFTTWTL
jgi:hypothetical protein